MKVVAINDSPHGPAFKAMPDQHAPVTDVFDAARDAGRHRVETGAISAETLNAVSRPLLPRDTYVTMVNEHVVKRG